MRSSKAEFALVKLVQFSETDELELQRQPSKRFPWIFWRRFLCHTLSLEASRQRGVLGRGHKRADRWVDKRVGSADTGEGEHVEGRTDRKESWRAGYEQARQGTIEVNPSISDGIWPTNNGSSASMRRGGEKTGHAASKQSTTPRAAH